MHLRAGGRLPIPPTNRLMVRQRTWVIGRSARRGYGLTTSTRLRGVFIRRWPLPRGLLVQHRNDRPSRLGFGLSLATSHTIPLQLPRVPTMATTSQQQTERDGTLLKLNEAIEDLDRAKEESSVAPAKAVFTSTSALLPTIRVSSILISVQRLAADVCRIQRLTEKVMSN